jgi:hypothetical protein
MKHISCLIILILCLVSTALYAGAWVQPQGEGLSILAVRRYVSHQYWTSGGRLTSNPEYAKNEIDEYVEYGLTSRFSAGFLLSALKSHTSANGTQGGMDDMMLFGRYLFWESGKHVASFQLSLDQLGRARNFNIPPQNSSFNSTETIALGTSGGWGEVSTPFWFADGSLGLVQRYSAGNQLEVDLTAGLKRSESLWLMLQAYNTLDLDHLQSPAESSYNLMTLAPSAIYWFTQAMGLQLGLTQDIYGQNVGKGRSYFMASWIRF